MCLFVWFCDVGGVLLFVVYGLFCFVCCVVLFGVCVCLFFEIWFFLLLLCCCFGAFVFCIYGFVVRGLVCFGLFVFVDCDY